MKLRASSAPLYDACPAAAYGDNDPISINPNDPAGAVGQATHKALAAFVSNQPVELGRIADEFALTGAQMKDMSILYAVGRKWWRKFGEQFGDNPRVEHEFVIKDVEASGHTDVDGRLGNINRVLDWKTSRLETVNYQPQMMQYLFHKWCENPNMGDRYQYIIVFLRDGTQDVSPLYTAQDVGEWWKTYTEKVLNWDGREYNPGGNCTYCPRSACCPALAGHLRTTMFALSVDDVHGIIGTIPDHTCVSLYERIRLAEKKLADAIEAIKLRAGANGGLQGDGKALILREQHRQTIKALEAWPILVEELRQDEIAPCVSIRKTSLLDAVGAKAPRGQKKTAKENIMARLEEAGAVETSTFTVPALVAATQCETKQIAGETDNE